MARISNLKHGLAAIAVACFVSACTKKAEEPPKDGSAPAEVAKPADSAAAAAGVAPVAGMPTNKQLTIGITQEFESLNPVISQMYASTYIGRMAIRTMVSIDNDWKWQCWICKEVPSLDNGLAKIIEEGGKKKMLVTWEIKEKAQWGDGTPITGKDVVMAWTIARDPAVSTGEKDVYERVEAIDVDPANPKKLTMKFKEARYDFYQLGTFYLLPSHLEGPVYEKTKGQTGAYEKQTVYTTDPTNPGLYNGPYLVKELKLGSHVIFEKNPKFYEEQAKIERIIFKLIPNTQTLEANLISGEIDMICELGMTFDQALAFEKRVMADPALKAKYKVIFEDGLTYEHVDFNFKNPILQDKNVRKALLYSIDRDKLTQALFEGRQKKAISFFHPRDVYYSENVTKYDYDPKKADELLEAAGWKKGASGFREKNGQKLALSIMTTAGNKTRELVEGVLKEQWRQVGIDVAINNEPARVFFGETVKKGAYPAMAMFAWISSPDNPPRSTLHSAEIPTEKNGWSGQNAGSWSVKRVDELLETTVAEFDVEKRKKMMEELMQIYTDELPTIPLYMRAEIAITPTNLAGFDVTGHQFPSSLSVEKWDLSGAAQQGH
jgi:peptide/nickel transport system substrate-binding protein